MITDLELEFSTTDYELETNFSESNNLIEADFQESDNSFGADFGEVQRFFTEPGIATRNSLGSVIVGSNLSITETGVLSVETATDAEQDNTRPITSAAVHTELGNIDILLRTI